MEVILLSTFKLELIDPLDELLGFSRDLERDRRQLASHFTDLVWVFDMIAFTTGVQQILATFRQELYDRRGAFAECRNSVRAGYGILR